MTSTALVAPDVTVKVGGVALDIVDRQFTLSLDEGNTPFYQANVVVSRPDSATYELLDPTKRQTVLVTVIEGSTTSFVSSFIVYDRTLDPSTDNVTVKLISVEYDLQSYNAASLRSWIAFQSSVRSIAEQVVRVATGVSTASVQLVGGAQDKAFRVFSEARNLFPNPDIGNVSGFAGSSSNTISRVQATGSQASYGWAVRSTATAAVSRIDVQYTQAAPVQIAASAGQQYTLSMAVRATSGFTPTLYLQFNNSTGATIQTVSKSISVGSTFGPRYSLTAVAPPNTSSMTWVLRNSGTLPSGAVLDAAQVMIVEGDGTDSTAVPGTALPYFSGATADSADYHYGWDGDANASESTRTPLFEREPDVLYWTAGTSAYDYLKPILDAAGLRLFLREDGAWCLADNGYTVIGQVVLQSGSNLYDAQEIVSIGDTDPDGFPMNADAVILNYSWTDPITGVQKTASDVATTSGYRRPYVEEIDQPYPGAGQAAYLLARFQARRLSLSATGRPSFTARPGMTALISLPQRPAQTGYVRALDFDLSAGQMTVTTKGLVTALPGSIGTGGSTQTIGSMSGSIATYPN